MIELELLSIRIFLVEVTLKIGQENYLLSLLLLLFIFIIVLKTNPWTYEIKDLNGEKTIGSFYEKELLLSIINSLLSRTRQSY